MGATLLLAVMVAAASVEFAAACNQGWTVGPEPWYTQSRPSRWVCGCVWFHGWGLGWEFRVVKPGTGREI